MRKWLSVIFVVAVILLGIFLMQQKKEVVPLKDQKTLIVYYSRTKNTRVVAELIQEKVGGTLFQLETDEPRPENYRAEVDLNEQEQLDNVLPKLATKVSDFANYDRVFIGAPTWNMALPQAVVTFLAENNFTDKVVIPFNTHGGYGAGSVFTQIKTFVTGAKKVLPGYSVKGGVETDGIMLDIVGQRKNAVAKEIESWLKKIGEK